MTKAHRLPRFPLKQALKKVLPSSVRRRGRSVEKLARRVKKLASRIVGSALYRAKDQFRYLGDLAFCTGTLGSLRRRWNNPRCDLRHVVMLVVSDLRIDPRVHRSAHALASAGYRVTVICPDISSPSLREQPLIWDSGIEFNILDSQAATYIEEPPWLHGRLMYDAACRHHPLAFHCHDLTTAIMGLSAAAHVGSACVCDFHEWFSENVSWNRKTGNWTPHPRLRRQVYRWAESLVLAKADEVITVCDSIARELSQEYTGGARKPHVIRNIPPLNTGANARGSLRRALDVKPDQFLLLWSGGTGPTRLLEPVIESLAFVPHVVLAIRGPSLDMFGGGYRELARQVGAEERLHLLPPVASSEVVDAARGADAGVWTLPNLSKNFYYALPNKIFEYMAAGLPIAAAEFPEVKAIVERYGVGVTFDPYDPYAIAAALKQLSDPCFQAQCRQNIPKALEALDADHEWLKLVRLYDHLGKELAQGKPISMALDSNGT